MWGNFMDKAKTMAANIDQQLNESVGIDGASAAISNNTPSTTAAAAIEVVDEEDNEEDNAWNDDFGFDDEEPAPQPQPTIVLSPPVKPAPPAPAVVVPPPAPSVVAPPAPALASPPASPAAVVTPVVLPPSPLADGGWDQEEKDADGNLEKEEEVVDMQQQQQQQQETSSSPQQSRVALSAASSMLSSFAKKEASQISSSLSSLATKAAPGVPSFLSSVKPPSSPTAAVVPTPISSLLSAIPTKLMEVDEPAAKPSEPETTPAEAGWDDSTNFDDTPNDDEVKEEVEEETTEPTEPLASTPPKLEQTSPDVPAASPTVEESPSTSVPVKEEPPTKEINSAPAPEPEAVTETVPPTPTVQEPTAVVATPPEPLLTPLIAEEPRAKVEEKTSLPPVPITKIEDDPRYQQLQKELKLREEQLTSKSMQLTELQSLWETQEQELRHKIQETKEEAKKRIMKARERCEVAEAKLKQNASTGVESSAQQGNLIAELRSEGTKLAHKQSQMEQAVRNAKIEARDLAERLEDEQNAKSQALEKIAKLETELKITKESLTSARKGESQAGKLESDLLSAREDSEMKAGTILSLQQQAKELNADNVELRVEIEKIRKMAAQEKNQEKKTLRREHNDVISDLETKLRTTEREAGVREDALRHEVAELRKRWQDAVRRADALSMDVQSSTAPLLRQLEGMERQNRARAAAWAELETRLRSELEETVIQNETLSKERSEFKTKYTRLERSVNERENELKQSKRAIEEQTARITKLEAQVVELEAEGDKRQEEYAKVERLANEGVMRVRSEMTQTVMDSEERYRGQIEKLENELRVEKEKRSQLEKQVEELLENAGFSVAPQAPESIRRESKPQKLRKGEGQAEILAGALGFDSDDDDEEEDNIGNGMDRGGSDVGSEKGSLHSFAALEQLSSRLKVAQIELEALRKNLRESENSRESLVEELGESRHAKEKLPFFEAKVKELAEDNRQKEMDILGLRDDITDVREMYRTQLNVLLEEKAAAAVPQNGGSAPSIGDAPKTEDTAEPFQQQDQDGWD